MMVNHLLDLALIFKKEHALEVQTDLHAFLEHGKNRISTERTTVWFLGFNSKPRFHPLLWSWEGSCFWFHPTVSGILTMLLLLLNDEQLRHKLHWIPLHVPSPDLDWWHVPYHRRNLPLVSEMILHQSSLKILYSLHLLVWDQWRDDLNACSLQSFFQCESRKPLSSLCSSLGIIKAVLSISCISDKYLRVCRGEGVSEGKCIVLQIGQ